MVVSSKYQQLNTIQPTQSSVMIYERPTLYLSVSNERPTLYLSVSMLKYDASRLWVDCCSRCSTNANMLKEKTRPLVLHSSVALHNSPHTTLTNTTAFHITNQVSRLLSPSTTLCHRCCLSVCLSFCLLC